MSTPRFFQPQPLALTADLALDDRAARHVQVLRLQPGHAVTLFDGSGAEFAAAITHMGKREVRVAVTARHEIHRELTRHVHLVVSLIANERFDWLIEKATELGAARITPLITERSVVRASGERAEKKVAHWQSIAQAACEQSGRNVVPQIDELQTFASWIKTPQPDGLKLLLDFAPEHPLSSRLTSSGPFSSGPVSSLSGPEGGLSPPEIAAATAEGWLPTSLGERVLRAETAPLVVLSRMH
jgi:16S rRNA (uracil1498-N3)-methyltransferase